MFSSEAWLSNPSSGFYNGAVTNSLRVNAGHTLSRAFGASPTSATTMSFGGWVKFFDQHYQNFFSSSLGGGGVVQAFMRLNDDLKLEVDSYTGSAYVFNYRTTRVFRDTSAWYHLWVQIDSTDDTDSNRVKIYVNGVRETAFDVATHVSGDGDTIVGWNQNITHYLGYNSADYSLGGYIADWYFLDGQDVSPIDTVGEFKNGIFIPKAYSATFGNKGFHLKFIGTGTSTSSGSVANPTNIGDDSSGKNNHWAVTSSGILSHDANLPDSPENNFCTWNPLTIGSQGTLSEGNLKNASFYTSDLSGNASTFFPESGKWYWEVRVGGASAYPYLGITSQEKTNASVAGGTNYAIAWRVSGNSETLGSSLGTVTKEDIPSFTNGDIISFALDVDARKLWVAENNTYADSGNPANGTGENASWTLDVGVSPFISGYQSHGVGTVANFGQDDTFAGAISSVGNTDGNGIGNFAYAPPSGFLALCTSNLPEPTISPAQSTQSDDYFNTALWSGNSGTQDVVVGFQPDWVWLKVRNHTYFHELYDSSRLATKKLRSNNDSEEATQSDGVTDFTASGGGFSLGAGAGGNESGKTYVAWNWKANGGTTSTNDAGSITSTVQASTESGFSIVTYTSNNSAGATVGHGLTVGGSAVAPKMVIIKKRSASERWFVWHVADPTRYIYLNETFAGETSNLDDRFGNNSSTTLPSSTVLTLGTSNDVNGSSGSTYVAYCFAEIEGYSKCGSYIANGSNDGTFVHTGFEISFLMIKRAVGGTGVYSSWAMYDNVRKTINSDVGTDSNPLFANRSSQEGIRGNGSLSISGTRTAIDFLSNGFKLRDVANEIGVSGNTYIYMAFAKNPFKYSTAQ